VENQTGKKIRVLRSDNGGEYTSKDFNDFCREAGIKRELTIPYNPQQNGVAERKNRSIVGAAKAMIHDQDLPMFLWAEACNTTVYVQNKSPHKVLEDKTPEEAFFGVKRRLAIFAFSVVQCISMYQQRRGQSWSPQGRRAYLLAIVRPQRHIGSGFQRRGRSW
jgi:hypothetical protein